LTLRWFSVFRNTFIGRLGIEPHCPWQNGRIERFFGTLKSKLDRWTVHDLSELSTSLKYFRLWYNHVRPHQNLQGSTPAEVWNSKDICQRCSQKEYWCEAWDGLLTGYYLPA